MNWLVECKKRSKKHFSHLFFDLALAICHKNLPLSSYWTKVERKKANNILSYLHLHSQRLILFYEFDKYHIDEYVQ